MEGFLVSAVFWNNVMAPPQQMVPAPPTTTQMPLKEDKSFSLSATKKTEPVTVKSTEKKRTVIIAPHPDDEILCCGSMLADKVKNAEEVKIIFLTNGDALRDATFKEAQEYGRWRRSESARAAGKIGIFEEDLCFLGFPDGLLQYIDKEKPVRSMYTDWNVSPRDACFAGTPYTKEAVKRNLTKLLKQMAPTEIYIPSETLDEHPDHKVAAKWTKEVLAELGITPSTLEYVVHGKMFLKEEISKKPDENKLKLIQFFRSQFWDKSHRDFMEKFASIQERFTKVLGRLAKAGR